MLLRTSLLCAAALLATGHVTLAQVRSPPAQSAVAPTPLPATAQTPPGQRPAQTPPTAQTPQPTRASSSYDSSRNIKLDLTITDNYGGAPSKKTVTMVIVSGDNGMIRTLNVLPSGVPVSLNVDARASLLTGSRPEAGKIRVMVTFEYNPSLEPAGDDQAGRRRPAQLHESLTVLLEDGKTLLVSQSADPATERRVTVELTATVQK
jgi:hypothetical protein